MCIARRSSCRYAITLGRQCHLSIILAPEDRADFRSAIKQKGYGVVDQVLDQIDAESATAFSPVDLDSIRKKILATNGGFDRINSTVKQRLGMWFEAQGGIRTAAGDAFGSRHGHSTPQANRGSMGPPSSSATPGPEDDGNGHIAEGGAIFASPSASAHGLAQTSSNSVRSHSREDHHGTYGRALTTSKFCVEDRVTARGYSCAGTVKFVGVHHIDGKDRIGIALDDPIGKNNGTVRGHAYFHCSPGHGLLILPGRLDHSDIRVHPAPDAYSSPSALGFPAVGNDSSGLSPPSLDDYAGFDAPLAMGADQLGFGVPQSGGDSEIDV